MHDDEDAPTRLTGKIIMVFDRISVSHQGKMVKPRTSFIAAVNTECFESEVKTASVIITHTHLAPIYIYICPLLCTEL